MRVNKARRLSVRVPALGWEAHISSQRVKNKRVTVANISAGGAYLITKEKHQPNSKVTLSIRSPAIHLSVTGMVVRSDPYGMALRFIDHSGASRKSLLRVISQYVAKNKPKRSPVEETPVRSSTQPLAAETIVGRERRVNLPLDFEQVYFHDGSLSAAGPRNGSNVAVSRSNSNGNNGFRISPAQTRSTASVKVFLSNGGNATVKCPICKKCHYTRVPKQLHNKTVQAKCTCGHSFSVLFDNRRTYRKEVRFPGEYWDGCGEKHLMTIITLSATGAGFVAGPGKPSLHSGETIQVNFLLRNNHNIWIKSKAMVKRVDGNQIGIEFISMNEHHRKCLGFYLMP